MEKVKKSIFGQGSYIQNFKMTEVLTLIAFLGGILLKMFYFQFTTGLNVRPFLKSINAMMMVSNLGMILIIIGIILLIFKKKRKMGFLIVNLIISLILLSDTIYYRYSYSAISVTSIYQLGLVGSVGDSILSLTRIKDIIYILDFPVVLLGLWILKGKDNNTVDNIFKRRLISFMFFSISGIALINIAFKNTDTTTFPYDNNYIIRHGGIGYYHYYDAKEFVKNNYLRNKKLTAEEQEDLNNYFASNTSKGENFKGISKGKNLIMVQMEALQQFVINAKTPSGQEITPNLNKLIKESQYFDNIYVQVGGGNTSDAELLSNASLYPAKEGAAYFLYPTNSYDSLANILREEGYKTYVSHANNPTFWNRGIMYNTLGFDEFFSNQKFELDEYVGWGLGDKSFYRQTLEKINKEEPFYSFMISLSSHYPFKYEYFEDYEFDVGGYEDTFMGYYLKSINYADDALGTMIENLKDQGIYDDSLIVVYGDHTAVSKDKSDELMEYLGVENNDSEWLDQQKVPLIIHEPKIKEAQVISKIGGQIDILPTIANLMDFDLPYGLGKDLLNTRESYAVLRNSTVITDDFYYLSSDGKVYDTKTNKLLEDDAYKEEIEKFHNQLYISDLILRKDAIENMRIQNKTE